MARQHAGFDLIDLLERSKEIMEWVADQLNDMKIPELPHDKRLKFVGACQHLAIEHTHAIVVLVDQRLLGLALALQRPMFEAFLKGLWFIHAATKAQVDDAEEDKFTKFSKLIANFPQSNHLKEPLEHIMHIL